MDSLSRLIKIREQELLKTRPVGMVWIDKAYDIALMSDRLKYDTEDLKSMYALLDDSIKNSPKGKAIYGYLYPESHVDVGDKFPDTVFHDLDGEPHKVSEFQGKWCLVDFWNSGCAPCIFALPELRELKKKYPDTLELISLSIDSESNWRKASERIPLAGNNWNEGKEGYGMFKRIGTNSYPTFLIVAPDGMIRDIWSGYSQGSLKHKVGFHLRSKGETEYTDSNGVWSVRFPKYEKNDTKRILDIDRIEMSDEGTKVYFSLVYYPKKWISVSKDAHMLDANGKKYAVIGSEGIALDEHLYADEDGNGSFSITFEAIPEDIKNIDFQGDEDMSIKGILLQP